MNLNNLNNNIKNEDQNQEKEPDINIVNYLKNKQIKDNINYVKALSIFNQNNIQINNTNDCNIHYYLEPNYTKEFYIDYDISNLINNPINYYFASFNANERGLEKSQLKTLFNVLKHYKQTKNNYVSINGGPGVGKSTIANYVISNLLLQDFDKHHNFSFKPKSILLTGKTIQSVKNITEITTINPPKEHQWISNNKYFDEINFLFYQLDINYRHLNSNQDIGNHKLLKLNENNLIINKQLLKYITNSFIDKFKKYFQLTNIEWNNLEDYLLNKINKNVSIIQSFNNLIAKQRNNDLANINNNYFKLNNIIYWWKNIDFKIVYDNLNTLILQIQNIDIFKDSYELNKIININKKIQKKFYRLFWTKKKVYNNVLYFIQQKTNTLFDNLNKQIKYIKNSIDEIQKNNNIEFELNLNYLNNLKFDLGNLNNALLAIDEIIINFNIIQKELDKKIRLENSFLWRHYQEWKFINKLYQLKNKSKNDDIVFTWNDLRIIIPIVSSNIQKIKMDIVQKN